MQKWLTACLLCFSALAADAESPEFVRVRRLADDDLAKKREGFFFTGLPDISSDPVTGFGIGARTNIYWNGKRDDPLFAYTPYLARLKVNVAYYTSNARELGLSLDIPYYNASRWRYKVDFKAQQNPANLYFGLNESTLGALRLPSSETTTYHTYSAYDAARRNLRPGTGSEAPFVTDALSNRFRETEYMLNLKADYTLGNAGWRILGGYEIQHLSYATFQGFDAEAVNPATGEATTAPNGTSLLSRDSDRGLIRGLDGGWISLVQTALIFDTRDFEPDPTRGIYFEIANEFSNPAISSAYAFNKLFVQAKYYHKLPWGSRTVLAGRWGAGNIFGENAPFFEFQDQWSPDGSINALGGRQSLRGYRPNRFLARSMWFANIELRVRLFDFTVGDERIGVGIAPFFDVGTVRDNWLALNFERLRFSYGGGLRIAWNQSTMISLDYGQSKEDQLVYFGLGQIF